jgi:DNA repair protein RadC
MPKRRKAPELAFRQHAAAGAISGIELSDHIIFSRTGYYSFLEDGL